MKQADRGLALAAGIAREQAVGDRTGREPSTRRRLLEATWAMFEQRGADFTLSEVAAAAGVSRQALYLHFGSRSGLFVEAVRHHDQRRRIGERFEEAASSPSGVASLEAWIRVWLGYLPEVRAAAEALAAAAVVDAAAGAAIGDRMKLQRDALTDILRRVEAEGALSQKWSVEEAAELAWSLIHVSAWSQLVVECEWSPQRFGESRLELIRAELLDIDEPRPLAEEHLAGGPSSR